MKKRPENIKLVGIRMPGEMVEQVDALAEKEDRDRSWIIRRAVSEYIGRVGASFCAPSVPPMERRIAGA